MSATDDILRLNNLKKQVSSADARRLLLVVQSAVTTALTDLDAVDTVMDAGEGDLLTPSADAVEQMGDSIIALLMAISQFGLDAETVLRLALGAEVQRTAFKYTDMVRSALAVHLGPSYHALLGLIEPRS